jgi:ABC-type lipoprotein export system ATPase subunit
MKLSTLSGPFSPDAALSEAALRRRAAACRDRRAIVTDPTLLLCDEPTGDLDRKSGDEVLNLLEHVRAEHGKTIIMVTHDSHASHRARRTIILNKGRLTAELED